MKGTTYYTTYQKKIKTFYNKNFGAYWLLSQFSTQFNISSKNYFIFKIE